MADTSGVLARLQAALSIYDPSWDVSVGSATYKILESVAQEIAIANNNSTLQTYSYDINTKFGAELDAFCNLFGVYRQLGKRASGIVTFSTNTLASNIIDIPIGTQVAVPIGGNYASAVYFATVAPAIIGIGETSTDVPVVSTLPGIIGNIPAGAITMQVSPLVNITSVTNNSPFSGGLDPESDVALRSRWQSTAFNNTTGTYGKYILTALQDNNVSMANAVGSQSFYSEQLQINSVVSGSGPATFDFVAYSGMVVNTYSGTVTYTGSPTVVAFSGFAAGTSGTVIASGIQTLINNNFPSYGITVAVTPATGTITTGLNINFSSASPYRLILGSGSTIPASGVTTSGITTISGTSFYDYVVSNNPDVGVSGTLSYNTTFTGYLYPQGNELVGSNLNSFNQSVYANTVDYYYPNNVTPQLQLTMANTTANPSLFIGNTVQVTSEYCPASNRSVTITSGNYVDIFINGTTADQAYSQTVFNTTFTMSGGASAPRYLNAANYVVASGVLASTLATVSGDIYVPLDFQPTINFPAQIGTANSGQADTLYLYNSSNGVGYTYPIALNPYGYITFTGTTTSGAVASGTNFLAVNNASGFLYPGLALASGLATSGTLNYISSVSSSGVTLGYPVPITAITGSTSALSYTISGKALVYPLYDTTYNSNSILQMTGLAFDVSTPPTGWPSLPTSNTWIQYNYNYNNDVVVVDQLVQQSRPIGVNTLVHQATFIPMIVNITLVISNGYSQVTVQSNVYSAIANLFSNYNYLGTISFSNINKTILSVPGVSNVRTTSINTTAIDGTILLTKTSDFNLASNQLPQLYGINYTIKGASNF